MTDATIDALTARLAEYEQRLSMAEASCESMKRQLEEEREAHMQTKIRLIETREERDRERAARRAAQGYLSVVATDKDFTAVVDE